MLLWVPILKQNFNPLKRSKVELENQYSPQAGTAETHGNQLKNIILLTMNFYS